MLKKWLGAFCAALLLLSCACAETAEVVEVATQIGENYVRYPQLQGMENEEMQSAINDEIVLEAGISDRLLTLITLGENGSLRVDEQAFLLEDGIFSAVLSARGKLGRERDGHAYTAFAYDLSTGERLTLEALFTDVQAAVAKMEAIAEVSLSEEMSGYAEFSRITPLPLESFTLDERGITFWYPSEQFSLLSGYSGACQFTYEELDGLWQERFAPVKLSAQETAERIRESVVAGELPQTPVRMGQSMQEVVEAYRLVRTPDRFPGGRYFVLEDPLFRGTMVISDALESGYERSVVEGVQLRRGALHGLVIGTCTQTQWRDVLGEPEETVLFTQSMAYDYNLPSGQYDVYHYGENELRLHADESGVLCAAQLCK